MTSPPVRAPPLRCASPSRLTEPVFPPSPESSSDILSSNPKTKEEFTAFADTLADFIISKHGNKPLYAAFVEEFAKALCDPLKDVQIRKASSTLSAFANEKQRQAKEAAGAGKKKKAAAKPALPSAKGV